MRFIDPGMDDAVVCEIDRRLSAIEKDERVTIPWAIDSGSRAWGFPSPDSDYDCRFVYMRSFENTFTLFSKRDVIEMPITPIYDVGGWELRKALNLLLKGNAVIIEWLNSPIVYQGDEIFRDEFLELAESVVNRNLVAKHYLHLALSMRDKTFKGSDEVSLKKLFYILRPLMAIDWLLEHPTQRVAPMNFLTLMQQVSLPTDTSKRIEVLLDEKSRTKEMGTGLIPVEIKSFMYSAFERAENHEWKVKTPTSDEIAITDAFHLKWIGT